MYLSQLKRKRSIQINSRDVKGALFIVGFAFSQSAYAQNPQPSATILENIRIFNGVSVPLSAPLNVFRVSNIIEGISNTLITDPIRAVCAKHLTRLINLSACYSV